MNARTSREAAHWFAGAAAARSTESPVVLAAGARWDAVKMPVGLVHAAVGGASCYVAAAVMGQRLDGPVIHDAGRYYYALVAAGTVDTWSSPLGVVLGRGSWVVTPRPGVAHASGLHWCVPVRSPGHLCNAVAVAELLADGQRALGEHGSVRGGAYRELVGHTATCATCRAGVSCPTSAQLGRAWREARR
ncbi:hypothetical protein OG786_27380 [Streptomyces sp. NBC_00101]|uniref:hypothetical protein n=1 Tax=Streptomyces sp. NBC_00101 TaxID=2975651 RepID=UPI0032557587